MESKFDKVFIGDFVGIFENVNKVYAAIVVNKNDATQEITVDEIFNNYMYDKEYRTSIKSLNEWYTFDEHSQNHLHGKLEEVDDKEFPEKNAYLRMIKINKIIRKTRSRSSVG